MTAPVPATPLLLGSLLTADDDDAEAEDEVGSAE